VKTPAHVVLYFQVHQPFRLRRYTFFDVGKSDRWFDDARNRAILEEVAARCYVPATRALREAVERSDGRFRCAFSISGTALDQLEAWAPEALEGFVDLARTGCVEFLGETSHHSLSALESEREFLAQARAHAARVERTFGRRPTTFRNTELVLDERVARMAAGLGYRAVLGEGAERLLGTRSAHRAYGVVGADGLRLLLRSYRLSDDVGFRFRDAANGPLTPERHAAAIARASRPGDVVGLFLDYETFGEHHGASSGILEFLARLPEAVLAGRGLAFATPSEAAAARAPRTRLAIPDPVSWADEARDLTAWLGNAMQREAHAALYALERPVKRTGDAALLESWRRLSTSDHFYYMCTKWSADGDVHRHFSPYASPHDAFISYMNVLDDLARRADAVPAPRAAAAVRPRRTTGPRASRRPRRSRR
jgi:alpha-amylase